MELLLSILVGIGLSAACGFRVFVPPLVISVASLSGHLSLAHGFEWMGTWPALVAFALATVLEIVAYYVPWLDNLLDAVATPAAVTAGIVMTAAVVSGASPFLRWTLAVIAGGGAAGLAQAATVKARGLSSLFTGGVGNHILSTGEAAGSGLLSILSVVLPVLAAVFVVTLLGCLAYLLLHKRRRGEAD